MDFTGRDFLRILDFSGAELRQMLDVAKAFKKMKHEGANHKYFPNKNIAIVFEKTSTRTRCSFEVAGYDLGMGVTYLDPSGSNMGHKESIADTARVLARFYDGIEFRGFKQETVETLAEYADVPVWNGLTDSCHPMQALADFMTIEERLGDVHGKTLAFVGDTHNNVSNSLMAMCAKMGMNYIACGPSELTPSQEILTACLPIAEANGCTIMVTNDINALKGVADAIYTDVWVSLGEDKNLWGPRIELLRPYQVNAEMMATAKPGAIFLHCLPSFHDTNTTIGKEIFEQYGLSEMEVTNEVFESAQSAVFDEAENRMHTIKAVMYLTLKDKEEK